MKPKPRTENKLEKYIDLITGLDVQFDEVTQLHRQRDLLTVDAERHGKQREEVLASTVENTTEEAIDHLAKFNARQEVFGAKLKHIKGQIEQAEEELQYSLIANFAPPFRALYNALMSHRLERAKAQIAKLIVPERVALMDNVIEQMARQSKEYVSEQVLEFTVPDGASTPLHDTAVPHSQYREQTLQILLNAVDGALQKAKQLLAIVEGEKGFTPPELAVCTPVPVIEPEPALA